MAILEKETISVQNYISLRVTNEVAIEKDLDESNIEKKDYNDVNEIQKVNELQYLVIKIDIGLLDILKKTESIYNKLDINKDYYLSCPVCKSADIKLKQAIYNEVNNDFEISYSCGKSDKLYNEFLYKFFTLNDGQNFLTQENYLIIKEILDNKIDGFDGYPFIEKVLQNKSIGYNRFDICDDINNPITNIIYFG